ncbi:MAG: amidohydrolase family protein [Acidobacteria bacterium]|nr:amidohydrolase family protein [Acidobacteriota bacterium]
MRTSLDLTRRQLLAGAGAGAAALFLESTGVQAQTPRPQGARPIVFTHTTVVTVDGQMDDVALAVENGVIAAIGPTEQVQPRYPNADVYDGRGKALFPGLINCHAHLSATIERGFNEDFGFPNNLKLAVQPNSLLSPDERVLMSVIGMIEAMKTGTTTIIENVGGIAREAKAIADTGLRCVFAESFNDRENAGVMSAELLVKSEKPTYSARLRDEGMQRIADLHSAWHGKQNGRISVFPAVAHAENCSGELLQAIRGFAEKHDLGYTIHANQSTWEADYMVKWHGLRPIEYLAKYDFLGPRFIAAHCRYVSANEIALLGRSRTIISHQPGMAGNRGANPPIPELRAAGATIAMGTDNNTNDVFTVLRVGLITERMRRNDATPGILPQPEDIFEDCTLGGATAVRQPKAIGSLEVGKKADLIVVNTLKPHLVPSGRILSTWIHNGQPSDVESSMVDGTFVMRNGKVLTVDEASLVAEADKVGQRVWKRVVEAGGPIPIPGRSRRR